MRKLSEIIEAAMPDYLARSAEYDKVEANTMYKSATPGMCAAVADNQRITIGENEAFKAWLRTKIGPASFVAWHLRRQKKASNRAARIAWWQNQLRILKAKGL